MTLCLIGMNLPTPHEEICLTSPKGHSPRHSRHVISEPIFQVDEQTSKTKEKEREIKKERGPLCVLLDVKQPYYSGNRRRNKSMEKREENMGPRSYTRSSVEERHDCNRYCCACQCMCSVVCCVFLWNHKHVTVTKIKS